jgi:hypothetical protein
MRRFAVVSCVFAACTGSMLAARLVRGDEIVDNAVVAHHRLVALHTAVHIYMNENEEQIDDPLHLIEPYGGGPTPESFWHPGDNDPMPTFIDNSIPNAPNSTQVSFLFRTGVIGILPPDDFLIWDASPVNNAGQFISVITVDGTVETIPPVSLSFPTDVAIAQKHLKRFGWLLYLYAYNHDGRLPETLLEFYPDSITWARSFWNPGDSDPVPTDITNSTPDALNSVYISFDFPAAGMLWDDLTPDTIVVQDNSPANNQGLGVNVLRFPTLSGRVGFVLSGAAGDSNGDERVDLLDWAKFQRCYKGWVSQVVTDDTCRTVDFDDNNRIDLYDYGLFVEAVTGP